MPILINAPVSITLPRFLSYGRSRNAWVSFLCAGKPPGSCRPRGLLGSLEQVHPLPRPILDLAITPPNNVQDVAAARRRHDHILPETYSPTRAYANPHGANARSPSP